MDAYFAALFDLFSTFQLISLILLPLFLLIIIGLIIVIFGLRREVQHLRSFQPSQPGYPTSPPPGRTTLRPSQPLVLTPRQSVQQTQPPVPPPQAVPPSPPMGLPPQPQQPAGASPSQALTPDRDATLDDEQWFALVEGCVGLYDEFDKHFDSLDPTSQVLVDHLLLRLQEILERCNVEVIAGEEVFDRHRHQPERAGTKVVPGAAIAETMRPGFAVGRRVLRRARVRLIGDSM